jgi:hypothetical protein
MGMFIGKVSKVIKETFTMRTNKKIQLRDTGIYLQSDADGSLKIASDGIFKQVGGTATRSGAGALDVTVDVNYIATDSADAITLADGAEGQRMLLIMTEDNGDGTVTPANLGNGSTITFDDVGDCAELIFINSAWYMIGGTATLG